MATSFSQLLHGATGSGGALAATVPPDWMQGRSAFGGLQVALALRAMRQLVPAGFLRTVQTTFVAPLPEGPVAVRAEVLRSGKSATHVLARVGDGAALVIAVFGAARASEARVMPSQPAVPGEPRFQLPFVPGVTPAFTQHFAMRWLRGSPPFTGDAATSHVIAIDLHDPGAGPTDEGHVVAIADLIAPIALSHLRARAPGSTLTWMLEFLTDQLAALPLAGWRVDAELVAAQGGYTSQSVMVWGPGGVPVALSRQSMLIFG